MKKKMLLALTMMLLILPLFHTITMASEFNFAVTTVIPDNQRDKNKTYFDLLMKPSQLQTIEIELRNDTDRDVKIKPEIHTATTNMNGVVEYGNNNIKADSTLLYKMEDIVTTKAEVEIPAKSSCMLKLDINMPKEEFDGFLAGGITLKEFKEVENTDNTNSDNAAGMSIKNEYAYVVAILLSENDSEIIPELKLNDVFPDQVNARNVISANIQNCMPMYMNQMTVEAKVTKKGDSTILYESSNEGLQMAPNSNFNYPIPLNGEKLKGGEYTLTMTAASMGEVWTWTRDFTIERDMALALNKSDVSIKQTDYTWLYVAIGTGLLLLVIVLWILILKKKKRKKSDEE
ncbi:DUF3324 domain-containing protein [Anaerocolumna sedimenticola]|uniref:DUF3324 domain-containing protein n=1 Tax=Anaerocolumna sedimenticola TaxID=2696063 RepID=A0A6P1TTS6_9FIRM|nr:DUF916 and DUF3324 domain-containing protein [Anaerocolumna sedimenticola]QHQ63361.1 DUF3324 domain-containing protein [Anaerocolumna sedimenticola]